LRIGNLNRRVEVLAFFKKKDEYGGEDGEWGVVDCLWAKIEPISGTEYFQANTINAETVVKITLRYNPKITVLNRIRYQNSTYEIIGVSDEKTAHQVTILNCKEMVNNGL
jgi:SPP1 family predicted phage head-tail adaptor